VVLRIVSNTGTHIEIVLQAGTLRMSICACLHSPMYVCNDCMSPLPNVRVQRLHDSHSPMYVCNDCMTRTPRSCVLKSTAVPSAHLVVPVGILVLTRPHPVNALSSALRWQLRSRTSLQCPWRCGTLTQPTRVRPSSSACCEHCPTEPPPNSSDPSTLPLLTVHAGQLQPRKELTRAIGRCRITLITAGTNDWPATHEQSPCANVMDSWPATRSLSLTVHTETLNTAHQDGLAHV
jgi:hypothetical protein